MSAIARHAMTASFVLLATLATAEDTTSIQVGSYTVSITKGVDLRLCQKVLMAIKAVGEEAIGQCVPVGPWSDENLTARDPRKPYPYLNWSMIRGHLPPDITVPDWQKRDLSDPKWREEASLALAIRELRDGNGWVSSRVSDQEMREIVRQYLRDGILPSDDGADHSLELDFPEDSDFWQSKTMFRGEMQILSRINHQFKKYTCEPQKEYTDSGELQFVEPNIRKQGVLSVGNSDFIFFDQKTYYLITPKNRIVLDEYFPEDPLGMTEKSEEKRTCIINIMLPEA